MSDVPQRSDWWQASDGKWYPPVSVPSTPQKPHIEAPRPEPKAVLVVDRGALQTRDPDPVDMRSEFAALPSEPTRSEYSEKLEMPPKQGAGQLLNLMLATVNILMALPLTAIGLFLLVLDPGDSPCWPYFFGTCDDTRDAAGSDFDVWGIAMLLPAVIMYLSAFRLLVGPGIGAARSKATPTDFEEPPHTTSTWRI